MCSLPSRGRERGTTLDARPRARARRAGRSSPGTTRVHGARRTHGPDRRRWAACSLCTARSHQPSSPNCSLRTCASHARVAALPYCGQRALTFTHPPRSDCPPARCPPLPQTHVSHAHDTRQEYSPARQAAPRPERTKNAEFVALPYRLPATGENGEAALTAVRERARSARTSGHM